MADEGLVVLTPGPRHMVEKGLTGALLICISSVLFISAARTVASGRGCCKNVHALFSEADASAGMRVVVQRRLLELKMSMMQTLMKMVFVAFLPWNVDVLNNLRRGTLSPANTAEGENLALLLQIFCGVAFIRPSLLAPKRLNLVFVVFLSLVTIQMTPFICCSEPGILRNFVGCLFMVVVLNVVKGLGSGPDLLLLIVGNLIFTGFYTYSWWSIHRHVDTLPGIATRCGLWLLLNAMVCLLSALLEGGTRKLLTQGLQLAEVQERHNAATALLRSIYDVVVELDAQGCVVGASKDLGSLLLRANPMMAGVQLAGLISDENDRNTFQRRLAAPRPKTVGLAENMHVSMRDSLGNTLRMEMMWFACDQVDGGTHSMVGIREFSDQAVSEAPGRGSLDGGRPDIFAARGADGDGDGSSASEDSLSLLQTKAEAKDDADVEAAQAMAVIDLTREDRPIRAITTGFRANVGHVSRNAPLARIVKRPRPMVAWLESAVNAAEHGEPQPSDHKVSLHMPQGKLVALCRLVLTDGVDSPSSPVDLENMVVLFHSVRVVSRRAAGTSHSPAGLRGTPANASNASLAGTESL